MRSKVLFDVHQKIISGTQSRGLRLPQYQVRNVKNLFSLK